jgi:hypothetical protein
MKLFKWQLGRNNTGYEIFTLAYVNILFLSFDCHFIRYKVGSYIPEHRDPVKPDLKHYRLNIELWPAKKGGELLCEKSIFRWGPINFFRPDEALHSVTKVEQGIRYLLSIGWVRKK